MLIKRTRKCNEQLDILSLARSIYRCNLKGSHRLTISPFLSWSNTFMYQTTRPVLFLDILTCFHVFTQKVCYIRKVQRKQRNRRQSQQFRFYKSLPYLYKQRKLLLSLSSMISTQCRSAK